MRLTKVHVTEFKSVQDSNEFEVGEITCLVGKNEAGKTALLQALYKLNPIVQEHAAFNVTDEYPRAYVEDYRQDIEQKKRQPATVVRVFFVLSPDEVAAIAKEFGTGCLSDAPELELSKGYGNQLYTSLRYEEAKIVRNLIAGVKLQETANRQAEGLTSLKALQALTKSR